MIQKWLQIFPLTMIITTKFTTQQWLKNCHKFSNLQWLEFRHKESFSEFQLLWIYLAKQHIQPIVSDFSHCGVALIQGWAFQEGLKHGGLEDLDQFEFPTPLHLETLATDIKLSNKCVTQTVYYLYIICYNCCLDLISLVFNLNFPVFRSTMEGIFIIILL